MPVHFPCRFAAIKLEGEYRNNGEAAGTQSPLIFGCLGGDIDAVNRRSSVHTLQGIGTKRSRKHDLDYQGSTRGKVIKGLLSKEFLPSWSPTIDMRSPIFARFTVCQIFPLNNQAGLL